MQIFRLQKPVNHRFREDPIDAGDHWMKYGKTRIAIAKRNRSI